MTEEDFIFGTKLEKEYLDTITDKEEKEEIGWEIRRRKTFLKLLTPEVKQMFLNNYEVDITSGSSLYDSRSYPDSNIYDKKKTVYYVYESYTCDDNKVCYVGYSCAPGFTYSCVKDTRAVMLREKKGLATRILIDNLTEFQSVVYSSSYKKECLKRGELLLNYELDHSTSNLDDEITLADGTPFIYKDLFLKHYFESEYKEKNEFDTVTTNSLACTLFLYNQNREIVDWLRQKNARIMRTIAKSVKSIIVGPYITYYDYVKYRKSNILVLSEIDVIDYIRKNPDLPLFYKTRKIPKARIKDNDKRDYIRGYLSTNSNLLEDYFQYMRENNFPIRDLQEPFSTKILHKIRPIDAYYTDIQLILMWRTSYLKNGNANRLIDLYIKNGLYEEALQLLKHDCNRAADYYYYKDLTEQ